ncbi:glucose 1-dehydrogenase [Butyricimonas hominis]|uniref:Glucose 1-dehydrogenase n=1 Tax=Butyricimonas hominis TaxID=2763032 RepID=A0ABR7D6B0_9BACT|nr:glucose 1-dehydrogenase [Butyricimonas hominis]MBC5623020.1 glucose 1-dehydrogenase [Butyricimonas hominis]
MDLNKMLNLTGMVAVVTGGGNGIGCGSAHILAQAGADVVIGDVNLADAEVVAEDIRGMGRKALALKCDVTKDGDLMNLVQRTIVEFGKLNILVNNVGVGGGGQENPFRVTEEYFERIFKVNVFSAWRLCQLAVPYMKQAGYGSIVNITSMASINRSPGMSAYASSKAALNHMTANLAMDFGPDVRINAVGPGAVETRALESVLTPEIEKKMLEHTPIKRLGEIDDIAGAVLFFAAPISSWITGQVLFVNGGGVQTLD